jgi:hypothetical protein
MPTSQAPEGFRRYFEVAGRREEETGNKVDMVAGAGKRSEFGQVACQQLLLIYAKADL